MNRKILGIIGAILLFIAVIRAWPEVSVKMADYPLDGEWELTEMRTAGIYGGSLETARALVGQSITIQKHVITSKAERYCPLVPLAPVTLRDDMETFGTSGGSWSELGLKPVGDGRSYEVLQADAKCDFGTFTKAIFEPASGLILLAHNEIYLLLTRR